VWNVKLACGVVHAHLFSLVTGGGSRHNSGGFSLHAKGGGMTGRATKVIRVGVALAGLAALAACGDSESTDKRGYTKAPLEHAGLFIRPEKPSVMNSLGKPLMPKTEIIPPPKDSTPAKKS
jgi:hypothetical protein